MRTDTAAARLLAAACALAAWAMPLRTARAQQATPSACANVAGPDTNAPETATAPVPRSPVPRSPMQPRDTGHVALRILASATADEVRFVGTPRICVRLTGDAQLDSVHVLARRNLASPVVSNTTYRNVYVAVEILGRLNAECIAGRITGARPDSASTARCASLGVQGGAGASPR